MKKFHISIGVTSIEQSIEDYSRRLDTKPQIIIDGQYALWRTETLNFSIRKTNRNPGSMRHLGWEDPDAGEFTKEKDVNGILWENFNEKDQQEEINSAWPDSIAK